VSNQNRQQYDQQRLFQKRLEPGEHVTLPMVTGSMAPLIPAGAFIEVVAAPADGRLTVGDVVVFRQGAKLVAHRLLFGCALPAPGWFLQRGDGVSRIGFVTVGDIVGLVVAVRRAHDGRHDLTTASARHDALRTARRTLYRLPWSWFRGVFRKDTP